MRILVTGGTGALGHPTVRLLHDAGHQLRVVVRDDVRAQRLSAAGMEARRVDLFDPDAVVEAVDGIGAVIHLATNVPPMSRMALRRAWRTHNRLRAEATRNLLEGARRKGVTTFVKESITLTYPDAGDSWIDESVEPDESVRILRPTLEGERLVARFGIDGGRGVVLRFGLLYGPDNRSTDEALGVARLRVGPVPGSPTAFVSSIHVDDAAAAVVAALAAPSGAYNVVDDEPLTRRDYTDAFTEAFDLPRLHILPALLARGVGGAGAKAFVSSHRVSNARLRAVTDWAPAYPSAREGWVAVAAGRATRARR